MLFTQAPDQPITTRIAEARDSPVSLVGLPCGVATKKLTASIAKGDDGRQLESEPFACGQDCAVGVRVKNCQQVAAIKVATSMVHDRGRVTAAITPAITLGVLKACNGENYVVASMPRIGWPVIEAIAYVAEVEFVDGTTWRADDSVPLTAFKEWMLQKKR
jgi:hypothetical protein